MARLTDKQIRDLKSADAIMGDMAATEKGR